MSVGRLSLGYWGKAGEGRITDEVEVARPGEFWAAEARIDDAWAAADPVAETRAACAAAMAADAEDYHRLLVPHTQQDHIWGISHLDRKYTGLQHRQTRTESRNIASRSQRNTRQRQVRKIQARADCTRTQLRAR